MKGQGMRKHTPQTVVIELKPKDEIKVSDEIIDKIPPSERTAFLIEHGYPVIIVHRDSAGKEVDRTAYNMENLIDIREHASESFVRKLAESFLSYMETPEGKADYEKWKKEMAEKENQ